MHFVVVDLTHLIQKQFFNLQAIPEEQSVEALASSGLGELSFHQ